jgi:hypothetical protein
VHNRGEPVRKPRLFRLIAALVALLVVVSASAAGTQKPLQVRVYADTSIALTDILWTGKRFLYVENTKNVVWSAPPAGTPLSRFASMPNQVEETRCRLSPGAHGFPRGDIYCHAPDGTIDRISADGSKVAIFARLPSQTTADGALAFDTVGRFGYRLIAATGRSGSGQAPGGTVYAIGSTGSVRTVGSYPGPGGADEIAVTPRRFATASGWLALTVDAGDHGAIVLMGPGGQTRQIASLPDGPNPISAITATANQRGPSAPPAGFYVTDTASHKVFHVPASELAPYVGDLIVGSELKALFWIVRPNGRGFQTLLVRTNLPVAKYNLEGGVYVAG